MIVMRIRYSQLGGHVRCRVFTAPGPGLTFAKCGELVFSKEEWNDVVITFECGGAEVIPEEGEPGL